MKRVGAEFFSKGKRYHLVKEIIPLLKNRNTLVELGCSLGQTLIYMTEKYGFNKGVGIDIAIKNKIEIHRSGKDIQLISGNMNKKFYTNGQLRNITN